MSWGLEPRLRMLCTTVLIILTGMSMPVSASGVRSQSNGFSEYYRRQDSPTSFLTAPLPAASTSTSSFDYWWPYPPASTSTSVTLPSLSTAGETDTDGLITSENTMLSTSDAFPSASSTSTSSSATLTFSTSSNMTSTLDSTGAGTPPITITALPPLTSPSHGSHAISAYRKPTNPLLFAPLFGILGGGIGLVCGWYGYGFWKRKWQARNVDRFAGPRYEGVEGEEDDQKHYESGEKYTHRDSSEIVDGEGVVETLDQPVEPRNDSAWPRVGLSALLRSPLLTGLVNGRVRSGLDLGGDVKSQTTHLSIMSSANPRGREEFPSEDLRSPYAPTVFSSVATSDEDDDEYEDARQSANRHGTVRHKSIRKRLAEKLQLQFSPRRGFGRQNLKESKARGKTPELEEGILLQDNSDFLDSPIKSVKSTSKQNRSKSTTGFLGHGRAISDFAIPVDEIRTPPRVFALEDPDVGNPSGGALQSARTYSTPLKKCNDPGIDDKYTPLPARKSRSTRKLVSTRSTKRRTEIMDDLDASPSPSVRVPRHVLPASPPLLNSPQLESELFFSSGAVAASYLPNMSRRATYEHTGNRIPPQYEQDSPTHDSCIRMGTSGPRQANKLRSKHSPARDMDVNTLTHLELRNKALPPSPPRRSTARSSSGSPTKGNFGSREMRQGRERSSTIPSAPMPMSPKERYEARRAALDRVNAIVGRSWSARLIQGIAPPTSPTMFGAYVDRSHSDSDARNYGEDEDSSFVPGIDQALGSP